MNLSTLCIKRPVFTVAMTIVMVIIGFVLSQRLTVSELPIMNRPVVVVQTTYSGASAELIENNITTPLEDSIAGVNGIDYMQSNSSQGVSRIVVIFKLNYDINVGIDDVRDKVNAALNFLPRDVDKPILYKADSQGNPSLILSVNDTLRDSGELTDYLNRYIVPQLEQVDGINNVSVWGSAPYAMLIWLNPIQMAAQHIAINDITSALQQQNQNVPAGNIQANTRYYPLVANANLTTAKQFSDLVIREQNGYITHFGDIAHIEVGPDTQDTALRINGQNGVSIAIIPTSTANPVDVANGVNQVLARLKPNLPPSMKIEVLFSDSDFINASIHEVYRSLIEALLCVSLVVFLFLGSVRSMLIPVVTIPVCLLVTFALLFLCGFNINTISLLAMVLAIGLVVDDAIVMLENIYRYVDEGLSPIQAAFKGSKEITFAVIAMTLTLVAVYLPVGFTEGFTGTIFRQFAVTLAGSVLISGLVALTLSPMMCSRLLTAHSNQSGYTVYLEKFLSLLTTNYQALLRYVLTQRALLMIILLLFIGLGYLLFQTVPSELAPREDRGYVMASISAPTNSSFAYTNTYAKQIEQIMQQAPGVGSTMMMVEDNSDPTSAFAVSTLLPWKQRKLTQTQITAWLQPRFNGVPGVDAFAITPPPLGQGGSSGHALEFKLVSAMDYPALNQVANDIVEVISRYPGMTNVQNSLNLDNQQFDLKINRNLASQLKIPINDITEAIRTFIGQRQLTTFQYQGENYNVLLQMPITQLGDLNVLKTIYLRTATGDMVPLSMLVNVEPFVGPLTLPHYNRLRVAGITAEIAPGYSLGQAVAYLQKIGKTQLPEGVQYAFSGSVQRFLEAQSHMAIIFGLALIFIYLILAAQFESFIDPFIVMLSVPLCLIGGLLVLHWAGGTLNVYSQIALVTLIGLITKHGILIVEFSNQQMQMGKDKFEAVLTAATLRLRPILMTTSAMVLGALPLALANGPGSIDRQQIGWVIVGGMLIGTFFSLFVVPVAYSLLQRNNKSVSQGKPL